MSLVIHSLLPGMSVSPDSAKRHVLNSYSNFKIIIKFRFLLSPWTDLSGKQKQRKTKQNKQSQMRFTVYMPNVFFSANKWYKDSCIIIQLKEYERDDVCGYGIYLPSNWESQTTFPNMSLGEEVICPHLCQSFSFWRMFKPINPNENESPTRKAKPTCPVGHYVGLSR